MRRIAVGGLVVVGLVSIGAAGCGDGAPGRGTTAAAAPAAAATVILKPRALEIAGIEVDSAIVAAVPEMVATTGEIEFDPARLITINAPIAGRLARLTPGVGVRVAAGDTVATIESPEFLTGALGVTTPRSGVVTATAAAPGQLIAPGAELLRIAGVDRVWLRIDLYGDQARLARPGEAVEAAIAAYPGLILRGRIASVAPAVEGATQVVSARAPLDNPSYRLLPGMFAEVRIPTGRSARGILVPSRAVIYDGSRRLVMIARDSTFFPSVVTLGPSVGDRVSLLRGVSPGERIVTKGAFELYNAGFAFTRGGEEDAEEQ